MLVLETARLSLRHFEPDDLEGLFALYRDPEIRRYFPDGTRTLAETKEELEWFRHGHPHHPELGLWSTVERSSGKLLGTLHDLLSKPCGQGVVRPIAVILPNAENRRRALSSARSRTFGLSHQPSESSTSSESGQGRTSFGTATRMKLGREL